MKVGRRMSERYLSVGSVGVTLGDPSLLPSPPHLHNNHSLPPCPIILARPNFTLMLRREYDVGDTFVSFKTKNMRAQTVFKDRLNDRKMIRQSSV